MTTKDIEEIVAKYTKLIHPQDLGEPTSKLENTLREAFEELTTITQHHEAEVERAVGEYKQFVLNVLDGVDIADGHCNTKAIRFALQSRVTTPTKTDKQTEV